MGIEIGGQGPSDMRVNHPGLYREVLRRGTLGLGEAYMDGLWDCDRLDQFFHKALMVRGDRALDRFTRLRRMGAGLRNRVFNLQSRRRAFQVGEAHYDLGNDVFEAMLDPAMQYSCGYWAHADSLDQAQQHKLELICRKLELKPGERLLDIGCGWGGLAHHAATQHGVEVVGLTISRAQQEMASRLCAKLPVEIRLTDYRTLNESFDKIVSVGMFEHVGPKNYAAYFNVTRRALAPDGLFLLHTIGAANAESATDPWIDRYIFPNGKIPAASEVVDALAGRFVVEDWHNFGPDYDRTLMAWLKRFEARRELFAERYGERFCRMWAYYLNVCAAYFRARQGQLWQLVLAHPTRTTAYRSVR